MKRDRPIIYSPLDNDFYQFTMANFIFYHPQLSHAWVKYAFRNRTKKVLLPDFIDVGRLREELDHNHSLTFSREDIEYLARIKRIDGLPLLGPGYLASLVRIRFPHYHLEIVDGQYVLEYEGYFGDGIYLETIDLATINQLYYEGLMKQLRYSNLERLSVSLESLRRVRKKIEVLETRKSLRFMEFGTRRRFSHDNQDMVIDEFAEKLPIQMFDTSNVFFARKYGLTPRGTMAHQLFMVAAGLVDETDEALRASQGQVLRDWREFYGPDLLIALSDTFGRKSFFEDFVSEAEVWSGPRQDSDDPFVVAEDTLDFYRRLGINPREKIYVPSDGLDLDKILALQDAYGDKFKTVLPGWGTNATNDVGFDTLSLVIKAAEANRIPLVKLSDNLNKATGPPEKIARYARVFGHQGNKAEECRS